LVTRGVESERLLAENELAGIERLRDLLLVKVLRGADDHGVLILVVPDLRDGAR
jgi:hypothetical protein